MRDFVAGNWGVFANERGRNRRYDQKKKKVRLAGYSDVGLFVDVKRLHEVRNGFYAVNVPMTYFGKLSLRARTLFVVSSLSSTGNERPRDGLRSRSTATGNTGAGGSL